MACPGGCLNGGGQFDLIEGDQRKTFSAIELTKIIQENPERYQLKEENAREEFMSDDLKKDLLSIIPENSFLIKYKKIESTTSGFEW